MEGCLLSPVTTMLVDLMDGRKCNSIQKHGHKYFAFIEHQLKDTTKTLFSKVNIVEVPGISTSGCTCT